LFIIISILILINFIVLIFISFIRKFKRKMADKLTGFKYQESKEDPPKYDQFNSFECHVAQDVHVLIIGPSGSGKTTFVKTLQDPCYVGTTSVASQTKEVSATSLVCTTTNGWYNLNIIDTPGFGDNTGQNDFELQQLILKFVKGNTTKLSMVLLCLPMNRRLDATQCQLMMNSVRFLGKPMRQVASILATHSEGTTEEEKQRWVDQLNTIKDLQKLVKYCNGSVYYTGMSSAKDAVKSQAFKNEIRKMHSGFLLKSIENTPVQLSGDDYDKVTSRFMVYESAAKDSLTCQDLLPKMMPLAEKVIALFEKLCSERKETNDTLEKYKGLNKSTLSQQISEWKKVSDHAVNYIEDGKHLTNAAQALRDQYQLYIQAESELQDMEDEDLFD
jgi:GTP-binding protein EngB required for normal cell division